MRHPRAERVTVALVTAAAASTLGVGAAQASAGNFYTYTYSYSEQGSFHSDPDHSLCGAEEDVTIDSTYTITLVTSLPGLDPTEVQELWDNDGQLPDGGGPAPIQHIGFHEQGTFTAVEGGHTYTGQLLDDFEGNATAHQTVFNQTGPSLLRATSELGTALRGVSVGVQAVALDGHIVRWSGHTTITGCLPNP